MSQKIIPNLWFNRNAEEALQFYMSVFKDCQILDTHYYPESKEEGLADFQMDLAGQVLWIDFVLFGQRFMAINADDTFKPNEAVSFLVQCKDQSEIDYYWDALSSDGGQTSVCGWLKDKYGYSWQVTPENMDELLRKPDAYAKMMGMNKIIIDEL